MADLLRLEESRREPFFFDDKVVWRLVCTSITIFLVRYVENSDSILDSSRISCSFFSFLLLEVLEDLEFSAFHNLCPFFHQLYLPLRFLERKLGLIQIRVVKGLSSYHIYHTPRDPDLHRLCSDMGIRFDGTTEKLPICFNPCRGRYGTVAFF